MRAVWFLVVLFAGGISGASAQSNYTVAYDEATAWLVPLVRELYAEIGIPAEFVLVPAERAIFDTNQGRYDADVSRVVASVEEYPNLRYAHEPIKNTELYAYVRKGSALNLQHVTDLKDHGYRIGMLRGAKFAEAFVSELGVEAILANSVESLHAMLAAGRFDIALLTSTQLNVLSAPVLSEIQRVGPVLSSKPSYHVFNSKHADLIDKFDAALRGMIMDGRLAHYLKPQ